jgi:hypothetical protein
VAIHLRRRASFIPKHGRYTAGQAMFGLRALGRLPRTSWHRKRFEARIVDARRANAYIFRELNVRRLHDCAAFVAQRTFERFS